MTVHSYATHLVWSGSTRSGWASYPRKHEALAPPAAARVDLSADPAFRGDAERLNPEQLLVMAAASCQMLSFLALAARHRIDVVDYEEEAEGTMDDARRPARIGHIRLAPVIRVAGGTDHERVRELFAQAHESCFIANSLTSTVTLEPTVLDT
ncbi:OsmC family protein [Streptomyces reniochalinae]|uniref:OsmC family peroxiredoxin n=1 Tax=Streptomyces reniochalinae TaxID=2250578 RepID=A0A367E6W5_9ACTN|nr:OsmC family protein [Streptomyces reniochalinae]RCG13509.1 OsmC family peroxiredoxin [Streptomyces reniochalinae]